jgi:hypothetical protein
MDRGPRPVGRDRIRTVIAGTALIAGSNGGA